MNEAERSLPYQPLACLGANVVDFTPVGPLVWPDPSGCLVGRFEYADGDTAGTLWLLEHHPAENLVAMNVEVQLEVITYRAGIWEIPSGRLVWEPENTVAMCWSPDGGQIILIRRYYERSPDHPPAILSPVV